MQTILITGASKGIGRAIVKELAKQKENQLVITSRSEEKLAALKNELSSANATIYTVAGDIRNANEVQAVVDKTLGKFGKIDVLINNAGLGIFKPVEDFTEGDWHNVMETNVKGLLLYTRAVVPDMKKRQSGHIITVESDVAVRGEPQLALYASSKFAQEGFTQSIRKELRPYSIRVSNVYPGLTDTDFHPDTPENRERTGWLQPRDIAEAVAYITQTPPHVVVDELTVHPKVQDY